MKVLALYPAFAPGVNEWAMVWKSLTDAGRVECAVLTGGSDVLKGVHGQSRSESHPGLEIRRIEGLLYPGHGDVSDADIEWAAAQKPDVIYCSIQPNLQVARRIAAATKVPIQLHCEYWLDDIIVPRRFYLGVPALRPLVGSTLRGYYRRGVTAIAVSNPKEPTDPNGRPSVHYLPWPHPTLPEMADPVPFERRSVDTVVYIGSISRWKGAEQLGVYFETLLRALPRQRVKIVGPLGDDTARAAIERLRPWQAEGRFEYEERIPRPEAIRLIGSSLAVLAPHYRMGWGLIGDAWGSGTPVIAVDEHYDIEQDVNAVVAPTPRAFVAQVQRLAGDPALWQRIAQGGRRTHREGHDVDVVAEKLLRFVEMASPAYA